MGGRRKGEGSQRKSTKVNAGQKSQLRSTKVNELRKVAASQ